MKKPLIGEISSRKPFHSLTEVELESFWVSSESRYPDSVWHIPNPTPGAGNSPSTVNWKMKLPNGTLLTDSQHRVRMNWARRLMGSLLFEPADGASPAPGSLSNIRYSIQLLLFWMVLKGYQWPRELNEIALASYLDDIQEEVLDDEDQEIFSSEAMIGKRLYAPILLWMQRHVLHKAGIEPIPCEPYQGRAHMEIARSISTKPNGWIRPLPDEVAIPTLNKAAWFIGVPGNDIIRLQSDCLLSRENVAIPHPQNGKIRGLTVSARARRQRRTTTGFEFSVLEGETQSWHTAINNAINETAVYPPMQRLRELVLTLRDACVITIQATSGMRISEVSGLQAGIDQDTGLPSCVRTEDSISGLNDLFIVRTPLSKTEETPRDMDWLVGMRPKDSKELPLAVRALLMLNALYAPYREMAGSERLMFNFNTTWGLPATPNGLTAITSNALREGMKNFLEEWVDLSQLPDESTHKIEDNDLLPWRESKGRMIKTHQLRKSWAAFTLAVDPRLMPAIQMQFHHISLAMTEGSYIGNNPIQVESLQAVSRQQRNLLIYETVMGKSLLAGHMGEQIEEHIGVLREQIKNLPTSDGWKETVHFCEENDLKIFFAPHGKCMPLSPVKMRCHESAGTTSWLNTEPNYSTREPSLCAGCNCFILDIRHKAFWEDRYLQNWISYKRAEQMGIEGQFHVVKERAEQAGKLLRKIGIDTEQLDNKIKFSLNETRYAPA